MLFNNLYGTRRFALTLLGGRLSRRRHDGVLYSQCRRSHAPAWCRDTGLENKASLSNVCRGVASEGEELESWLLT
jgi:hypothetical protein